jgi:hypothetical protein
MTSTIEVSSTTRRVALDRVVTIASEPAGLWVDLEQSVNGLSLEAGRFGHALRGSPGRCAKGQADPLGCQDPQNRVDNGGLADAWPAGDDEDLGEQRLTDRGCLTLGQ